MRGYSDRLMGEHLKAGWLPGILTFSLLRMAAGLRSRATAAAGPPASTRQVPVRVTTTPMNTGTQDAPKAKKPAAEEVIGEEQGLERYAARLKQHSPCPAAPPRRGKRSIPIDLNLKNADLVEAVRVLADTMGINYSIDPKVKGTVNVRATGNLTQSDLMSILETLLPINGATLIKGPELVQDRAPGQGRHPGPAGLQPGARCRRACGPRWSSWSRPRPRKWCRCSNPSCPRAAISAKRPTMP